MTEVIINPAASGGAVYFSFKKTSFKDRLFARNNGINRPLCAFHNPFLPALTEVI